ncbi:hypothetical protein BsWGS_09343 [Bradybaena similaris]
MKIASMLMATAVIDALVARDSKNLVPVSMRLQSEFLPDHWLRVNFYGETFQWFYQCLSSNNTVACTGHLTRDGKQPFAASDRRVVRLDKPEEGRTLELDRNYFSCEYDFPRERISCRRLDSVDRECDAHTEVQHIGMLANDSSVPNCVGFIWQSSKESLVFVRNVHRIQLCNDSCNVSSTVNTSHVHEDHDRDRPDWEQSEWHNNPHHWGSPRVPGDEFHDAKAHIIIIIVAGIGVTTILVIAAGIFRRKILQMKTPPATRAVEDAAVNRKPVNRKVSSSSRNFTVLIPEKASPVILNPSKLYSDI